MCKRVIIGLFTMSLVALVWTDANAGCCCNVVCASWIAGSGPPTGLVTTDPAGFPDTKTACPVTEDQGSGIGGSEPGIPQLEGPVTSLTLRVVGNVPTMLSPHCGLKNPEDQFCDIKVVAFCGDSTNKTTTSGPLAVKLVGGMVQTNDGSGLDSANLTFQLSLEGKADLCPPSGPPFKNFLVPEGLFEACVNGDQCVRERCKVDLEDIKGDRPLVYKCKSV